MLKILFRHAGLELLRQTTNERDGDGELAGQGDADWIAKTDKVIGLLLLFSHCSYDSSQLEPKSHNPSNINLHRDS